MRRALSPMASPLCAAGTHWLTITPALPATPYTRPADTYGFPRVLRKRRTDARSRTPRAARPAAARSGCGSTKRSSVPSKSFACSLSTAASCPSTISSCRSGFDRIASISAATCAGCLSSYSTPAPSIVAGTAVAAYARTGICFVERLDQRHAEAFVFACAEEQVGELRSRRSSSASDT